MADFWRDFTLTFIPLFIVIEGLRGDPSGANIRRFGLVGHPTEGDIRTRDLGDGKGNSRLSCQVQAAFIHQLGPQVTACRTGKSASCFPLSRE